jgi:glucosylceramidase
MKDNNSIDGGNMRSEPEILDAHALYLARFVEEYEAIGLDIEMVMPQNEPGYETRYPSCLWTPRAAARLPARPPGPHLRGAERARRDLARHHVGPGGTHSMSRPSWPTRR